MKRILISDPLGDGWQEVLAKEPNVKVDVRPGLSPDALCEAIGDYAALIVRSATLVTRPVIDAARNLQVIGRAGAGVDNIDIEAATERGIVVLNAPAAFRFTGSANPERHLKAAAALGTDISKARLEDAGSILADRVIQIMKRLNIPNGLSAIGYNRDDIPQLVEGTLPQHRVIKLSPRPVGPEELTRIFEDAMVYW